MTTDESWLDRPAPDWAWTMFEILFAICNPLAWPLWIGGYYLVRMCLP